MNVMSATATVRRRGFKNREEWAGCYIPLLARRMEEEQQRAERRPETDFFRVPFERDGVMGLGGLWEKLLALGFPREFEGERDREMRAYGQGVRRGKEEEEESEQRQGEGAGASTKAEKRSEERERNEDALTELDVYERMASLTGDQTQGQFPAAEQGNEVASRSYSYSSISTSSSSSFAPPAPPAPPATNPESRHSSPQSQSPNFTSTTAPLSLISTLTTTERVTLSDGSVRTKRVLRKRFADGSEENNESEEVQAPRDGTSGSGEDGIARVRRREVMTQKKGKEEGKGGDAKNNEENRDNDQDKERKRGGWFWS